MVEPDNLVLSILREIRTTQTDIQSTLANHTARFEKIEVRMDEMHESMVTALGLAAHANIRHDTVEKRLADLTERVERLEARK